MPATLTEGHLSDDELVRLLDGQLEARERPRVESHSARCDACGARLRRLRRRSARLTGILLASDPEAPPAPARAPDELTLRRMRRARGIAAPRPWLRAAAVAGLLLAAGVVASPLRAVVAEWLRTQWERVAAPDAPGAAPAAEAPAAPAGQPAAGARVQFTPRGATFTLEVAVPQADGAVEVRRAAGPSATAEQTGRRRAGGPAGAPRGRAHPQRAGRHRGLPGHGAGVGAHGAGARRRGARDRADGGGGGGGGAGGAGRLIPDPIATAFDCGFGRAPGCAGVGLRLRRAANNAAQRSRAPAETAPPGLAPSGRHPSRGARAGVRRSRA